MRFADQKVRNKLALVMIFFALALTFLLSGLYYYEFKAALQERVLLQLSSVRQLKSAQIEQQLRESMTFFANGQPNGLEGTILFEGFVSSDTVVEGFPVRPSEAELMDLTPYHPEGIITLGFMSGDSSHIRHLVIVETDLQRILMERTGLGETGESYLVGVDKRMRSSSRFFPDQRPTDIMADTEGVSAALRQGSGQGRFPDYRGIEVFSAYGMIRVNGLQWVILSEIDEREALFPLRSMRFNLLITLGVVGLLILIISYQLAARLVRPVLTTERLLQEMSLGHLRSDRKENPRNDEFGRMFRALNRLIDALERTVVFTDEVGAGNFEVHYEPLSDQDKMGKALVRMKDRLKTYHENEKRLKQENQRLLIQGEESERSRLSKELHDGLGPLLTLARMKIESGDLDGSQKEELLALIQNTITEMRRISNNLMPAVLLDFGAGEAIRNLLHSIRSGSLSVQYQYNADETVRVPSHVSVTVYRVVQEAVNNVLRHARATEIKVSLTEFPDRISLFLKDNGQGFDVHAAGGGNGIRNMRERVLVENGIFELISGREGTSVEVEIPI